MYKEDFLDFKEILDEVTKFIVAEKGEEVISDYQAPEADLTESIEGSKDVESPDTEFTSIEFEDI